MKWLVESPKHLRISFRSELPLPSPSFERRRISVESYAARFLTASHSGATAEPTNPCKCEPIVSKCLHSGAAFFELLRISTLRHLLPAYRKVTVRGCSCLVDGLVWMMSQCSLLVSFLDFLTQERAFVYTVNVLATMASAVASRVIPRMS